jgi:hypothetical protein
MKNILGLAAFFALSSFAHHHHDPIVAFNDGEYLGMGNYVTNTGEEGNYSSYAEITSDTWNIAHYHGHELRIYGAYFTFDDYGFFDVLLTDNSNEEDPKSYPGQGHCGSFQCHVTADFEDAAFEVTATFFPWIDSIVWLGSIQSFDEDGYSISWEETMTGINSDDDTEENN